MNYGLVEAGGGFMGIGPTRYMYEAEQKLQVISLAHRFAFLIATSVGALDLGLLACGYSAHEILQLHYQYGQKFFSKKNWAYTLFKNGPKYDDSIIMQVLKETLGDIPMHGTATPFYATAYDMRKRDIKVFGPDDIGVPVWYAVRCSMAASTYFSPMQGYTIENGVFKLDGQGRYGDGGFCANVPSPHGIAAAITDLGLQAETLRILTLVTSGKTPESDPIDSTWNVLTVLKNIIIPAITAGNSSDVKYIVDAWIKKENHFFVRPDCKDYDLDDTTQSVAVESLWGNQFNTDQCKFTEFMSKGE